MLSVCRRVSVTRRVRWPNWASAWAWGWPTPRWGRRAAAGRSPGRPCVPCPGSPASGGLQPHTRVSLGGLMAEQANSAPEEECFLFEDRVHTNAAVDHRIDEVVRGLIAVGIRQGAHIGVLMDTSPSAVAAIAALSRLGAVAVLLPPDDDLAAAVQLCEVADIVTDPRPSGGGRRDRRQGARSSVTDHTADLGRTESDRVVELDRLDLSGERLPQWYRPNPGRASDLAFVFFSTTGGRRAIKEVTNHRWALSAYGTATAAALGRGDTIYCLTPLHHPSGLMVGLGGAVAGGSRIALTRGVHPTGSPTRSTVTASRWCPTPGPCCANWWRRRRPSFRNIIRSACSSEPECQSGCGTRSSTDSPRPECWNSMPPPRGTRCWPMSRARRPGPRVGRCRAAPRFGSAATTPRRAGSSRITTVSCAPARTTRWACCWRSRAPGLDAARVSMRGVFAEGDTWITTDHLFRRDSDGDYWFVDNRNTVIQSVRGPVFCQPICDALGDITAIDLAVVYPVATDAHDVAVAAVTLGKDGILTAASLTTALSGLPRDQRPAIVHIVDRIPLTPSYRPLSTTLRKAGLPAPGQTTWYHDHTDGHYRQSATA